MTERCCPTAEQPCPAPPHPNLVARLRQDPNYVTPPQVSLAQSRGHPSLSARTGTLRGLNDGSLFPGSHFDPSVSPAQMSRAALERTPLRGNIRVAIVLAEFTDKKMRSDAVQHFQELFFSKDLLPNGSVSEYYKQVSNNNIDLTGEVVGPVRLPHKLSYYANGNSGMNSSPPNAQSFAADALSAVDGLINFNPYDNDGNGYVDAFIVIHAGQGAEESASRNDLWSLKWVLPQQARVDNVNIYAFLTVPEDAYIGVCAHEIGHLVFGWPDLYDIDQSSEGIGDWCLMAGGSWGGTPPGVRPCHPSAWCKSSQGWIRLEAPQRKQQLSLGAVEQDDVVYRLWSKGDTSSKEYFLLENREPIDYDTSLPGFGLLVWHIDDAQNDNSDESHPKVSLMQADGLNQLATSDAGRGDNGDPFPGRTTNTEFTPTSKPNSDSYRGLPSGVSVSNIPPASRTMNMQIAV